MGYEDKGLLVKAEELSTLSNSGVIRPAVEH